MELTKIENLIPMPTIKRVTSIYKQRLKKSVEKYGQLRPILIDSNNKIIDGYLLFVILKELGYEECFVKKIESETKNEQIYLEVNTFESDFKVIPFIKYVRDYVQIDDNSLDFSERELKHLIETIDVEKYKYKKISDKDRLFF